MTTTIKLQESAAADVVASIDYARNVAAEARRRILADPGDRTPEDIQSSTESLDNTAIRAERALLAIQSGVVE